MALLSFFSGVRFLPVIGIPVLALDYILQLEIMFTRSYGLTLAISYESCSPLFPLKYDSLSFRVSYGSIVPIKYKCLEQKILYFL